MYGLTGLEFERSKMLIRDFNRLVHEQEYRNSLAYEKLATDLLVSEFNELTKAIEELDEVGFLDGWCDVLVTGVQYDDVTCSTPILKTPFMYRLLRGGEATFNCDFDYFSAIKEVCRSNMSKVPTIDEVKDMYGVCHTAACGSAVDWIESNRPYKGIKYEIIDDEYGAKRVVFKDENGKVMKPWCFEEPNLAPFITYTP